ARPALPVDGVHARRTDPHPALRGQGLRDLRLAQLEHLRSAGRQLRDHAHRSHVGCLPPPAGAPRGRTGLPRRPPGARHPPRAGPSSTTCGPPVDRCVITRIVPTADAYHRRRAPRGVEPASRADRAANGSPRAPGYPGSTAWVWVTRAASRPPASRSSVSATITVRPTLSGRAVAATWPAVTGRRKLVAEEMVAVPRAPSGRLRNAHQPPAESASAISAPPCSSPPAVQRVPSQSSRSTTSSGPTFTAVAPSTAVNGMAACSW